MNFRTAVLLSAAFLTSAGCASRPKTPPTPASVGPIAEAAPTTALPSAPGGAADSLVRGSQADLAATAGDRVYFAFDRDGLDPEARAILRQQAAWLAANPSVRARIAGNADERGTREYNLALGARRASAARQFLIVQGVAPARLETISYGKERPIEAGSDETAWARNRNAGTVVIGIASW